MDALTGAGQWGRRYLETLTVRFGSMDLGHVAGENPRNVFLREKLVLETALDVPIVSVAAHAEHCQAGPMRNRSSFTAFSKKEAGISYDAYDEFFTRDMKYIPDSTGNWRKVCMCEHSGNDSRMQILVHPC